MSVASEFVDIYAPYMRQKQMSKQRMQQMQMMDQLTRGRIKEQQRFEAMQNSVEYARQWDKEREDRQRAEELMGRQWKREDRVREDEQEHEIEKAKIYTSRYGRGGRGSGSNPTESPYWEMSKFYTDLAVDALKDERLSEIGKGLMEIGSDFRERALLGEEGYRQKKMAEEIKKMRYEDIESDILYERMKNKKDDEFGQYRVK